MDQLVAILVIKYYENWIIYCHYDNFGDKFRRFSVSNRVI